MTVPLLEILVLQARQRSSSLDVKIDSGPEGPKSAHDMHPPARHVLWSGVAALALAGLLGGCASGQASAPSTTSTHPAVVPATPRSELTAITGAQWSSNTHVTYPKDGAWTFASDGLPAATLPEYYAIPTYLGTAVPTAATSKVVTSASLFRPAQLSFTIPTMPQYIAKATTTALGPIGVTVNGALFFNAYEADASTVALSANFTLTQDGHTGAFVDTCNGHFTPPPGPVTYHYHGLPGCIVSNLAKGRSTHAPTLLGFAFDGFGIYDNVSEGDKTVRPTQLDACNGIYSPVPGYPQGIYHYVLLDVATEQSSIGCFHGVVSSAYTAALRAEMPLPQGTGRGGDPASSPMVAALPLLVTAQTLAADSGTDAILVAELRRTGFDTWCQ